MTMPRRPPQEFLDWLDANYSWNEANSWKLSHARGEDWLNDSVYQYWEQNISPGGFPAARMDIKRVGEAQLPEQILSSRQQELFDYLSQLGDSGQLTEKEVNTYLAQYWEKPELFQPDFLNRLPKAGVEAVKTAATLGTEGQDYTARANAYYAKLWQYENDPDMPPEALDALEGLDNSLVEQYLSGQSDQLIPFFEQMDTYIAQRKAQQKKQAQLKSFGEEQRNLSLLDFAQRPRRDAVTPTWQQPQIPTERSVIEPYLKGAGMPGEGTRFRSFIESKMGQTAADLQARRQDWWNRINPAPGLEEETREIKLARMGAEQDRWATIAGTASTSETEGNTYYGEGGLAAMAKRNALSMDIARGQLANEPMGALDPDKAPWQPFGAPAPEEDPLTKALKNRNWWAEYSMLPGTGVSPRISPAVRFR